MNNIFKILQNQFELNDSINSYDYVSYIKPEIKKDEKGLYKEEISYMEYKGEPEYPNNGIIGRSVTKIYQECEHTDVFLYGTWYKCRTCDKLVLTK